MAKSTYVLGTGLSHDGSVCLLRDGVICVAIEKERLTRRKHDGGNDRVAMEYCLAAEGIGLSDVDVVVQNANFSMLAGGNAWYAGPRLQYLADHPAVFTISHHLAHAYSAVGTCPFADAAVLVIDGCGSSLDDCLDCQEESIVSERIPSDLAHCYFEKDSYYALRAGLVTPIYKDFSIWGKGIKNYPMYPSTTLHSIGGVYQAASKYVFGGFDDSGKLMGLAPFGREGVYKEPVFDLADGRVFVRYQCMEAFNNPVRHVNDFQKNFQEYADLAYWIQREVERAILYIMNARFKQYPSKNLCYSGGVALNAVANGKIRDRTPFENIYIQPAAGDNGLAIGCAYYGWMKILNRPRIIHNGSTCFGPVYDSQRVSTAVSKYLRLCKVHRSSSYVYDAARLLAQGKVVGWFNGSSEFGPRALGHRSVLADPSRIELRDYINSHVKCREEFRPFAPAVLDEDAKEYFSNNAENPYMLVVGQVKEHWRRKLAAVVHRDGSSRVQIVTQDGHPIFYELIAHFKELTGLGLLLNTSLNRRGMPIVETPEQALGFFVSSGLDAMVLEGVLLEKERTDRFDSASRDQDWVRRISTALPTRSDYYNGVSLTGAYEITIQGNQTLTVHIDAGYVQVLPHGVPNADVRLDISAGNLYDLLGGSAEEVFLAARAGRVQAVGDVIKLGFLFEASDVLFSDGDRSVVVGTRQTAE